MGGREVYHVPTGFGFSPKASGFYPFDDATALAGESGVGDVAWLIQASASNHKPKASSSGQLVYHPLFLRYLNAIVCTYILLKMSIQMNNYSSNKHSKFA